VAAIATGAVVLAAVGVGVGMAVDGEEPSSRPSHPAAEASSEQLRSFAAAQGHAVYWAGALPGRKVELTEKRGGDVFVRYLSADAPIGDPRREFTTVATYPLRVGAFDVAMSAARKEGMVSRKTRAGGVAVWSRRRPTNVYLAYPASTLLVEVYDPSAQQAQHLALSGDVRPVR
jgi:hypothetical protein